MTARAVTIVPAVSRRVDIKSVIKIDGVKPAATGVYVNTTGGLKIGRGIVIMPSLISRFPLATAPKPFEPSREVMMVPLLVSVLPPAPPKISTAFDPVPEVTMVPLLVSAFPLAPPKINIAAELSPVVVIVPSQGAALESSKCDRCG